MASEIKAEDVAKLRAVNMMQGVEVRVGSGAKGEDTEHWLSGW